MPKKLSKERIVGKYFIWLLGQRDGVYTADGRSNRIPAGRPLARHQKLSRSPGSRPATRPRDGCQAGLSRSQRSGQPESSLLGLEKGKDLYLAPRPAAASREGHEARHAEARSSGASEVHGLRNQTGPDLLEPSQQASPRNTPPGSRRRLRLSDRIPGADDAQAGDQLDDRRGSLARLLPHQDAFEQAPRHRHLLLAAPEIAAIVEFCKTRHDLAWLAAS